MLSRFRFFSLVPSSNFTTSALNVGAGRNKKKKRKDAQLQYLTVRCVVNHGSYPSRVTRQRAGPGLKDFLSETQVNAERDTSPDEHDPIPYVDRDIIDGCGRLVYFETYGCQMNINDTEIAWSILRDAGYARTTNMAEADVILAVTCAIRENAEKKVWSRLNDFKHLKTQRRRNGLASLKIGILGCMAERLKEQLLETDKMVDLVAGPDSYRDLPRMLTVADSGQAAVNVQLSLDETYADVSPVRMNGNSPSAFVSVMRGCDNMCSFCIVPFTRGRERARPMSSILDEIRKLSDEGIKEVTLLGQNVNSYRDLTDSTLTMPLPSAHSNHMSRGFSTIYKPKEGGQRFAELLHHVAQVDPEMRIRFTSPHPKDFPNELLEVIKSHGNICKQIHLPVQSGSTAVLKRMRRGHSRETYLELVKNIRETIPRVSLSSDFITGFCGETESDHQDTLSLLKTVRYNMAYMFAYSMRKKTHAYHRMVDDVLISVKQRRLKEIVDTFYSLANTNNQKYLDTNQLVLVEGFSKKSNLDLVGRADSNIKVVFPITPVPCDVSGGASVIPKPGDFVKVKVSSASAITLRGHPVCCTNLKTL